MKSAQILSNKVRENILKTTFTAKSAHIASALSIVDIITVIYLKFINKKNKNIFILSKGHACLAHYCLLHELKYISKKVLNTYGKDGTILMSHSSHKVPVLIYQQDHLAMVCQLQLELPCQIRLKK